MNKLTNKEAYEIIRDNTSGIGQDLVKKYSRNDLLEKLEDWSYKLYKLEQEK